MVFAPPPTAQFTKPLAKTTICVTSLALALLVVALTALKLRVLLVLSGQFAHPLQPALFITVPKMDAKLKIAHHHQPVRTKVCVLNPPLLKTVLEATVSTMSSAPPIQTAPPPLFASKL